MRTERLAQRGFCGSAEQGDEGRRGKEVLAPKGQTDARSRTLGSLAIVAVCSLAFRGRREGRETQQTDTEQPGWGMLRAK